MSDTASGKRRGRPRSTWASQGGVPTWKASEHRPAGRRPPGPVPFYYPDKPVVAMLDAAPSVSVREICGALDYPEERVRGILQRLGCIRAWDPDAQRWKYSRPGQASKAAAVSVADSVLDHPGLECTNCKARASILSQSVDAVCRRCHRGRMVVKGRPEPALTPQAYDNGPALAHGKKRGRPPRGFKDLGATEPAEPMEDGFEL